MTGRVSVEGFGLPPEHPFTENEVAWITFLRLLTDDKVQPPKLRAIQALRRALDENDNGT